jgi:queuosine precursor transporter
MIRILAFAAFLATVPIANWMIGHVGICSPGLPCLIPVGFGLMAPSGVLMIGAALALRDLVHELGGLRAVILAIGIGGLLSLVVAPPALAGASVIAFLLSELADLGVYAPLRRRQMAVAILLSGMVGAIVDSAVFLWLAFGSLDLLLGQVIGKAWISALAAILITAWNLHDDRNALKSNGEK